jgi:nucleoside-diphosphate-sugar epimerase
MPKIVITGAAGFIGSRLAFSLANEGYDLVLIDNFSHGHIQNLIEDGQLAPGVIVDDVRNPSIAKYFSGTDTVFHLAAISSLPTCQSDPKTALDINVGGTGNVLEAARLAGVRRFVFASTSAIYENNTQFPCKETDAVSPTTIYSQTKEFAEKLVHSYQKNYGMQCTITRYYNVYGPNQDMSRKMPPFVSYVIKELLNNRAPVLHGDGSQERDYVYIDDVNEMNRLCMNHPQTSGRTFNVASGKAHSVNEIYALIRDLIGGDIKATFNESEKFWDAFPTLFEGPFPLSRKKITEEVNKFTLGATDTAKEEIGWEARTSIPDGMSKTIEAAKKWLGLVR